MFIGRRFKYQFLTGDPLLVLSRNSTDDPYNYANRICANHLEFPLGVLQAVIIDRQQQQRGYVYNVDLQICG